MFTGMVTRAAVRGTVRAASTRRSRKPVATFGSAEWARKRGPVMREERLARIRARNAARKPAVPAVPLTGVAALRQMMANDPWVVTPGKWDFPIGGK